MSAQLVPPRAVAALFLARQWLDRPRARRLTAGSLQAFAEATCGVQIDSVNVLDRAHHLTLWSRFGPYDRAALERLIYRRRVLFEYLSHVACFVSTGDLPIWRATMAALVEGWPKRYGAPESNMPVARVEAAIAEAGVVGQDHFERAAGTRAGSWWGWKPEQHALDYLWKAGRIAVHSRVNFQKRYALMSRVLPQLAGSEPLAPAELPRERVRRALAAMGAATADDLRAYWSWPGSQAARAREALAALVREGEVSELRVEGDQRRWFARAADLPALERAARVRRPSRGTTLLCPFDSFLWHRERAARLWGFHYRIEIYVPAHRRTVGYYTLPILHEGQLVGRVDLKSHRDRRELEARHVHFEPWLMAGREPPGVRWGALERDAVFAGLAASLRSLAAFTGAERVRVPRVTPARWRAPLQRALREVG